MGGKDRLINYEPVIGLEIHAQLLTGSKIFCACSTAFTEKANSNVCPVCLGLPGSLPVLNKKVIDYALMAAHALHCSITGRIEFARKNYFYADLPKGYQITQYKVPLAEKGWMEVDSNGENKRVGVSRIHVEEDAGKSIHRGGKTLLDFNRCGVPLIEVVTDPHMSSSDEAVAFVRKIRRTLRYLRICSGNMEEGGLRCDANISVTAGQEADRGTKVELKNMNTLKGLRRAIDYEITRQGSLFEESRRPIGETRLWDGREGLTRAMREKEEGSDYRYFPEPDLPDVKIDKEWIVRAKRDLPELPDEKKRRFVEEEGLPEKDAAIIASDRDLADYFESCVREVGDASVVSNWIVNVILGELKRAGKGINEIPAGPRDLAGVIGLVKQGVLSVAMGKETLEKICAGISSAEEVIRETGGQISDEGRIGSYVMKIMEEYPREVAEYRAGKGKLLGFFIGRVMEKTGGKANPKVVREILKKRLQD